jgi:hypothetical protein
MLLVRVPGTTPMKPAGPLLLRCGGAVGDIIIGDTPAQKLPLLLLSKLQRTGKLPLSVLRSGPGLDATTAAVESAALVMAPNSGGADSTCTKLPLLQPAAAGRPGLRWLTLLLAVAGCRSCCKPCAKKQNGLLRSPPERAHTACSISSCRRLPLVQCSASRSST